MLREDRHYNYPHTTAWNNWSPSFFSPSCHHQLSTDWLFTLQVSTACSDLGSRYSLVPAYFFFPRPCKGSHTSSRTRVEVPLPCHAYNFNSLPSRIRSPTWRDLVRSITLHAFSHEERPCEVYYPSCQLPSGGAFCRPPCRLLRSNRATTQRERLNGIVEVRKTVRVHMSCLNPAEAGVLH